MVEVSRLVHDDMVIEIEAIAYVQAQWSQMDTNKC
jgi:enamine deaminase RidA (YjgF/YER057c/UK114 family)